MRHTTNGASNVAFFDDFQFNHFTPETGIQAVAAEIGQDAQVDVYTANGMLVKSGKGAKTMLSLAKGVYVVKVRDGQNTKTIRFVRK